MERLDGVDLKRTSIQPGDVGRESRFIDEQGRILDDGSYNLEGLIRLSMKIIPDLTDVGLIENSAHQGTGIVVGHIKKGEERFRIILGVIDPNGTPWTVFSRLPQVAFFDVD